MFKEYIYHNHYNEKECIGLRFEDPGGPGAVRPGSVQTAKPSYTQEAFKAGMTRELFKAIGRDGLLDVLYAIQAKGGKAELVISQDGAKLIALDKDGNLMKDLDSAVTDKMDKINGKLKPENNLTIKGLITNIKKYKLEGKPSETGLPKEVTDSLSKKANEGKIYIMPFRVR